MIEITNTATYGWREALRGMRNPMNSWDRADSDFDGCNGSIGPNDHELMMKLAKGGSVHAKYRRMIIVYADILAPLYWWKEFDTYKVGTVANSCSTMHKIHAKEFELNDFSNEHLSDLSFATLSDTIDALNEYRKLYKVYEEYDIDRKKYFWWQLIQLLPSSYNQKRTVMMNYEVLSNIYISRKDHKLDEWRDLCKWIEELPYSEIITLKEERT